MLSSSIGPWQREQLETLRMIRNCLARADSSEMTKLRISIDDYLAFRKDLDQFLTTHFNRICTQACYSNNKSACCGKDGILTFFAEVVINVLLSNQALLDELENILTQPNRGRKCVYLGMEGCLWRLRPLVCALFLCDQAELNVFAGNGSLQSQWDQFKVREKLFKWPDRPVLFDRIEKFFISKGYRSKLMYCHNSPGLLRVKQMANKYKNQPIWLDRERSF